MLHQAHALENMVPVHKNALQKNGQQAEHSSVGEWKINCSVFIQYYKTFKNKWTTGPWNNMYKSQKYIKGNQQVEESIQFGTIYKTN